jgi:ATP-dependent helicase HrpA
MKRTSANLNLDFLLGICRRLMSRRPDLRVVVTSATIETRRFASISVARP